MNKTTSFVVFGNTGSGKSTFANTMIEKEYFKTSDDVHSETKETIGCYGEFMHQPVYVVDTPGLQDSSGLDAKHLTEMTTFIRQRKEIQSLILVINFTHFRLDDTIRRMLQLVASMYPEKKWYHHIAVVWSNYWTLMPPNIRNTKEKKREGFKDFLKREVVQSITQTELDAIPQYFVDSIEAREDSESREELKHLIAWISQCSPIGEIKDVHNEIKNKKEEEREHFISQKQHLNIVTKEYIKQRRFRQEMYNGSVTYTEWENVPGSEFEKQIVLPPEPFGKPVIEKRVRTMRDGQVVKDAHRRTHTFHSPNYHGDLYLKYKDLTEERVHQPMTDGTTKVGDWKVVSERKYEQFKEHVIRDTMRELEMLNK